MPGMAVATTSSTPEDSSRFETRRRPWSSRYSTRASSGVIDRARTSPSGQDRVLVLGLAAILGAGRAEDRPVVAQVAVLAEGGGDARLALELDDQDRQADSGGHAGQGRHHGGLAHAALAGHDQDLALAAEGADVHDARSVVSDHRVDGSPRVRVEDPVEAGPPGAAEVAS